MAQAMAEDGGRVPMSPGLQATLLRAREYAAGQSEAQVLLEHLLLALSEDADAASVLDACQVDPNRLRNDVAGYLGTLDDRVPPGTPGAPAISPALTQVLKYATLAAQQGRRSSIDGAIVLAALVGDGRSMAASFLKAQGLTFEAAIQALRQAATKAVDPPQAQSPTPPHGYPDPATATPNRTEDILARARERVETRSQVRPEAPSPQVQAGPSPTPTATPVVPSHQSLPMAPEPHATPIPPIDTAEARGDHSAAPRDASIPSTGPDHSPPASLAYDEPVEATPPAARHLAELQGAGLPATPPAAPQPSLPASEPARLDAPKPPTAAPVVAEPERTAIPSPPPEPAFDPPAPSHPDRIPEPAPDHRPAPPPAPEPEPQHTPAGWAPPPMRPATTAHTNPRLRPPPPQSWAAPPLPPGQPPRPPGPFPDRPVDLKTPPGQAQWSTPPVPVEPRRELPTPGYTPSLDAPAHSGSAYGGPAGRRPAIDPSQITHSVPRRLRQGRPHVIEIWIERPPIAGNPASRSYALRSENVVARAIAVRLRPLSGKFVIDAASPETQWDQSGAAGSDRLASEAAVWRFTVTPLQSGRGVLQLAISARTLGADGVLAETQLPDQMHQLRVSPSYGGVFRRLPIILGAALAGMVLIKLVEAEIGMDFYYLARQLLRFNP